MCIAKLALASVGLPRNFPNIVVMASSAAAPAAGGLFNDAAVKTKPDGAPKSKRDKLKKIDTVAAKVLDPCGVSIIDDVPLDSLWKIVCKGDKWCKFFTEFAAQDKNIKEQAADPEIRVAIGISTYAETMENCIKEFQGHDELRSLLKPTVLAKFDEEAKEYLPYF